MPSERETTADADRLDTGEPIRVEPWYDGRFHAIVAIKIHDGPIDHHALGATAEEACARLRSYVAALRGQATLGALPESRPPGFPDVVCRIKGTAEVMQCRGGTEWQEHLGPRPAVVDRCTACDDFKAKAGVLDDIKARWDRYANQPPPAAEDQRKR